jgi:hypothetical protein
LRSHRVGCDEAYAGAANGKNEGQAAAGAGFAQGEVAEFSIDKLLFDDEGIVAIALLGFLRRDGMASKVAAVGIVPIKKRCWRLLQTRVPALYLPLAVAGSQIGHEFVGSDLGGARGDDEALRVDGIDHIAGGEPLRVRAISGRYPP